MAGHQERLLEHGHQFFRHLGRAVLAVDIFQQHDEFVAAQARQGIAFAQARRQLRRHLLQQFVADMVAQGVVHVLEAVEVDKQDGQLFGAARGAQQGVLQAVVEQQAVRQRGERIVVGQVVELFLRLLDLGDVARHAHVMGGQRMRVAHRADGQPFQVDLAILAPAPQFAAPETGGDQFIPHGLVKRLVVAFGARQRRVLADRFGLGITGDLREGGIDGDDHALDIDHHHGVGDMFEHGGRQAQLFLGLLARGNVGIHPDAAFAGTQRIERAAAHQRPERLPSRRR